MSEKDDNKLSDMATAIARLHAFILPFFIWKMIWEEVIPRRFDERSGIDRDVYKIFTSTHGFANLLALWYICSELYQGIVPAKQIIQRQLSLAPGVGKEPFSFEKSRKTTREILSYMVLPSFGSEEKHDSTCLGWFVEKGGKILAKDLGHCETKYKDSVRYIYYANEIIENNVVAIVETAFAVCDAVTAKDFVDEQRDLMMTTGAINSQPGIHEHLNIFLRTKIANLILEQLRENGFQDKNMVERINKDREESGKKRLIVDVAALREKSDRIPTFKKYDLAEDYPTTMYIRT